MSEKVNKFASITAIKAVVYSFFVEISKLSGGGGALRAKPLIPRYYRVLKESISGINRSLMRNFFSWRDGFLRYHFRYL